MTFIFKYCPNSYTPIYLYHLSSIFIRIRLDSFRFGFFFRVYKNLKTQPNKTENNIYALTEYIIRQQVHDHKC